MGEEIQIFLQLGDQVRAVRINSLDTVQSLEQFLPPSNHYAFHFEEFDLSPAFSLRYAGVSNSSVIRAIAVAPETQRTSLLGKSSRKGKDPHADRQHMKDELTDQFYKHVEGTVTSYRRLVRRFLTCHRSKGRQRAKAAETVIPEVAAGPATTELPRFW
jgi:hypothetical protein